MVKIFTDGSSYKNGKPDCIAACGIFIHDTDSRFSMCVEDAAEAFNFKLTGKQSNNVGELMGILAGLCLVENKSQEIIIYSDSQYCINSISLWSKNWAKNNWITAGGTPVKNKELIMRILEEKEKFKFVFFVHVKGHKKEPIDKTGEDYFLWNGNFIADQLATEATKKARNKLKN